MQVGDLVKWKEIEGIYGVIIDWEEVMQSITPASEESLPEDS